MKIAIAAESDAAEPRVAGTPETVKKFIALGAQVAVEAGAGARSGIPDDDFKAAGATVAKGVASDADIVLKGLRRTRSRHTKKARSSPPSWTPTAMSPRSRLSPTRGLSPSPWN
jgi:NAD(P) transhydrogenase subunit alpha